MITVGIDEVGRGCWAGPLVAAAVILRRPVPGLRDSKKLSPWRRTELAAAISEAAVGIGVGWVWPEAIDNSGISISVKRAMVEALSELKAALEETRKTPFYDEIVIDGNINYLSDEPKTRALIKADDLVPAASAASIIAKVARDAYMAEVAHASYPEYGFARHVGYGTPQHIAALASYGVTPLHRKSYKPIRQLMVESDT